MLVLIITNEPLDLVVIVGEPILVVLAFVSVTTTIEVVNIAESVIVAVPLANVPVPRFRVTGEGNNGTRLPLLYGHYH